MIQEQNKLSNNELKKLIYKIQSEGLRVYIKPYKDPYTFEDLKSIIIRTEDGKLVNAENVYTQDKKEIKALTKMYDEIQNERIARKNCFERLEKIVQDELNYQAEMVTWRDGYYRGLNGKYM